MEIRKANVSMLDSDEIEITLDLSQSKRFRNEENFDYEHIDADLFIKSLDNAPLILNHRKEKIVSDNMKLRAEGDKVIITAKLDQTNPYASYVLSLREHSSHRLGCSFGFIAIKDEIRNRLRTVKELVVKEISVLTNVEPAYYSSIRCYDDTEVRELTIEELQEMIDKSVAKALRPKEEIKEEPKVEPKVEEKVVEQPKEQPKPVEVKLDTDGLKAVFNDFLEGFKAVVPQQKEEPKQEEVKEEPKQEVVKEELKVEEQKQEEVKPAQGDDETLKAYQKMLDELN